MQLQMISEINLEERRLIVEHVGPAGDIDPSMLVSGLFLGI